MLKIVCVFATITILGLSINQVWGADYPFNEATIQLPWQQFSASTDTAMFDYDNDGKVDSIYTLSGSTLNRKFGVGVSSLSILSGNSNQGITGVRDNLVATINYTTSAPCQVERVLWNILNGSRISTVNINPGVGTGVAVAHSLITSTNKTYILFLCTGNEIKAYLDTSLQISSPAVGFNPRATPFTITYAPTGFERVFTYNQTIYQNASTYANIGHYTKSSTNTLIGFSDSATIGYGTDQDSTSYWAFDKDVKIYRGGLRLQNGILTTDTLLKQRELNPSDSYEKLALMHPRVVHDAFTANTYFFIMESAGIEYLGAKEGTTIYYTTISSLNTALTNRALTYYRLDTTQIYLTKKIEETIPTASLNVNFPNSTEIPFTTGPNSLLPSGYFYQDPTPRERYYYPEYTNQLSILPIYSFASPHTEYLFTIKNAPDSAAIKFEDQSLYNSQIPFVYGVHYLQADDTTTIALENSKCVRVYVSDSSLAIPIWVDLGTVCASGATSKTLTYTENLAFTFWTLPWGTSTTYTESGTTNSLSTLVRNAGSNYTYGVKIYDRNGTKTTDVIYTNNNGLSIKVFNTTSTQKPLRVEILDTNNANRTLHFVNVGNANYLQAIQSFANQYLTINGFSLLAMMPLIFAAMFTRNTVGIGTVMTVIFIATLVWFGIISVPEILIYLMLFIAAIGLIAYKLLY